MRETVMAGELEQGITEIITVKVRIPSQRASEGMTPQWMEGGPAT